MSVEIVCDVVRQELGHKLDHLIELKIVFNKIY
jgi:hypothetical protein